MSELTSSLKEHFGFDAFHHGQEDVVQRIVMDEDVCVVMPTGAGKSLCYQLPALLKPGYALVLSPLISLMKDQVDALRQKGIPAAYLNSSLTAAQQRRVVDDVAAGRVKLLYIAPERLRQRGFISFIQQQPPEFLVVDEAHCMSQWGHDFRPDYARIGDFLEEHRIRQVCAFTATATPRVREDIKEILDRPEMENIATGFLRPNLSFQVVHCRKDEERLAEIAGRLNRKQPTIIYAATRKAVDQLADEFQCIPYHAGMTDTERRDAQERFISDDCPVVAATNAFGMGIDRADIRQVIHYNMPGSLEAYYQEAGRAGRDGEPADCVMLFGYGDRYVHEFFIELSHPPEDVVLGIWDVLRDIVQQTGQAKIEQTQEELAARVAACRGDGQVSAALNLLEKAGVLERGYRRENRGTLKQLLPSGQLRQTFPARTQRGLFIHRIIDAAGEQLADGCAYSWDELATVSGLKPDQVKRVVRALNGTEFSWTPPFAGRGVQVTRPGVDKPDIDFEDLRRHEAIVRGRLEEMMEYPDTERCRQKFIVSYFGQDTENWLCATCDNCKRGGGLLHGSARKRGRRPRRTASGKLVSKLKGIRKEVAEQFNLPVYRVFSNRALEEMAEHRPKNTREARQLTGIGPYNSRYLPQFLQALQAEPEPARPGGAPATAAPTADRRQTQEPPDSLPEVGKDEFNASDVFIDPLDDNDVVEPPDPFADTREDLFEELRQLRLQLAKQRGVPAYRILSNKALQGLCEQTPVTVDEALQLSGIGKTKRDLLPDFLAKISEWRNRSMPY